MTHWVGHIMRGDPSSGVVRVAWIVRGKTGRVVASAETLMTRGSTGRWGGPLPGGRHDSCSYECAELSIQHDEPLPPARGNTLRPYPLPPEAC